MKQHWFLKILIAVGIAALPGRALARDEIFHGPHGGDIVRKSGLAYEVVRKPKEVIVYPDAKDTSPVPSVLTIKFKNKTGKLEQVKLNLMPMKEPDSRIYSAPIPAPIYISGGATFELE